MKDRLHGRGGCCFRIHVGTGADESLESLHSKAKLIVDWNVVNKPESESALASLP